MTSYRRRIRLTGEPGRVVGDLEDDFHHFRVALHHDGHHVTRCEGEALRFPWTACERVDVPLRAVVGAPLAARSTSAGLHTDPRQNCTHLFDLAGLAIAQAVRPPGERCYEIEIPDRVDGRTHPTLTRYGEPLLTWDVRGGEIEGPAPFAGVPLRRSFMAWAEATLEPDIAEAAIALRRACDISFGRQFDLDSCERASDVGANMVGTCHTYQPGVMETALRMRGSSRPLTD